MAFWWMCYVHADWLNVTVMKIYSIIQAWDASQRTHEYSTEWQRTCGQGHRRHGLHCVPQRGLLLDRVRFKALVPLMGFSTGRSTHRWACFVLHLWGEFPSVCSFEGVWFRPVCLFWALANDGTEHKVWSAAEVPPLSSSLCSRSHSSQSTPSLLISACAFSYRKKPPVHWNPLPSWIRATVGLLLKQGLLTLNWYKAYESNKTCFAIEAEREALMLSLSEFRWLQSISLSYKYTETQTQENSDVQL